MKIASAKDLTGYKKSYALGMRIFEVTKRFPDNCVAQAVHRAVVCAKPGPSADTGLTS